MNKKPQSTLLLGMLALGCCLFTTASHAQEKKSTAAHTAKGDGYTKLPSGIDYKIAKHGTGKQKPKISDHLEINLSYSIGDSVLFDSRKMNGNKPVPFVLAKPRENGDPVEVFPFMTVGDSAVIRFPLDSLKKNNRYQAWMDNKGGYLIYNVTLESCLTEKQMTEQAEKQKGIDDKLLKDYFAKNDIKATKTASGLYYTVEEEGKGEKVKAGEAVNVNYTGMFMDGKKFDSNTDTMFHHVQPFVLEVGKGRVIKGWDEGLQLLNIGSKAKFFIPSYLAYGSLERSNIPANSILIFEVEVSEAPDQAKIDDKLLQDYFKANDIHPTKTASGLYYTISQKGLGDFAKPGKKVTMNYTGKTLDGKTFDSNTDPQFKHVQPFTFELGKGMVIKGWDEGVQLLKLGSKGTFYIPSGLAYGAQGAGGQIPPNTVLMFDVEVTGIDK